MSDTVVDDASDNVTDIASKKAKKSAKAAKIVTRKKFRVSDLYVVGVPHNVRGPVQLDDGTIEMVDIPVWLNKISPQEERVCADVASAARGATMAVLRLPLDHQDWDDHKHTLADFGLTDRDAQIEYLITEDLERYRVSARERIAAKERWSEDDYLMSLEGAWNESLRDKFLEDDEDPEAKRVYEALLGFANEIDSEVSAERENLFEDYAQESDDEVYLKALKKLVNTLANVQFMDKFYEQQVFYSVREPDDHSKRYFQTSDEVKNLPPTIFEDIRSHLPNVESMEGKD